MSFIFALSFFFYSCSSIQKQTPSSQEGEISLSTALDQAQASYTLGCVQAFRELNLGPSFSHCKKKAMDHRLELNMINNQIPFNTSDL